MSTKISRRDFIRAGVAVAGTTLYPKLSHVPLFEPKPKIQDYRILGRTGLRVSDVSLGAGVPQDPALIKYVLDLGVNYIDTAEHYSNGRSERVIGEAVKGRRKDVFITTKLAVRDNNTEEQLIERFFRCLERLQTDHVDVLMFHNPSSKEILTLPFVHKAFQKLKSDGKVRFFGLSCHEPHMVDICNFAIEDGRFDVLLFVYNFMQEKAAEVLKHAAQKNVGSTIMKVHASEHPEQIRSVSREEQQKFQDEADRQTLRFREKYDLKKDEYFRAAISWVLQNAAVGCVVTSIRTFDQANDYVSVSGKKFTKRYKETLDDYSQRLFDRYCRHACGECEPYCPHGVAVNDVLRLDTYFTNYRQEEKAITEYAELEEARKPTSCLNCPGICEPHCPYGLPVRERLLITHNHLSKKRTVFV